ncbi:hypothetical protein BGX27_000401 [Mortierella sp. AM989]|nr:hypothetical protein BGX27_000401 [Mortierella sp. AM989]
MNRNIPLIVAVGVGVMSGFYIWEPSLKKYQRESKGTWQYEVVQQTRSEELNHHADTVADATNLQTNSTGKSAENPAPATVPSSTNNKSSADAKSV